jgi:hypothetical protein
VRRAKTKDTLEHPVNTIPYAIDMAWGIAEVMRAATEDETVEVPYRAIKRSCNAITELLGRAARDWEQLEQQMDRQNFRPYAELA